MNAKQTTETQSETPTNEIIEALLTEARKVRTVADSRRLALEKATLDLRQANAPFDARIRRIEMEREKATASLRAKEESANAAVWEPVAFDGPSRHTTTYSQRAEELTERATALRASLTVPTDAATFVDYCVKGGAPWGETGRYGLTADEPTRVMGLLLFAARGYEDRYYLAVSGDGVTLPLKVRGWLHVVKPSHRGDSTASEGEFDGKPFLYNKWPFWRHDASKPTPVRSTDYTPKPLAQFKAAIAGEGPIEDCRPQGA
jgi:hypothetical protein